MKIAVDCRMIRHSGIGTVLRELLPFMLSSSHRFLLLGDPEHLRDLAKLGPAVCPFREPIYSISEQVRYPRRALRGTDVLLYPHYNVPFLPPVPMTTVLHDLAPLALPHLFSGPLKRLYAHLFFRRAVSGSAGLIAVSHFTKGEMVRRLGADPARVRVVHNGPGRTFPEAKCPDSEALKRYGIAPPYVLAVGNLKPHKNLAKLVRAFLSVRKRGHGGLGLAIAGRAFPDATGGGGLFGFSGEELRAAGVMVPGFVQDEDLPALYRNAELLVLPSLYEGFGLTALEALRFGTLPLVSDAASLPEVIDDPELRFDPLDAEAMAERISFFLDNPVTRDSKIAAQRKGLDRFSWQAAAMSYLDVLQEAAGR